MPGNSFGNLFKIKSFGESHGRCFGGVIDGVIPNLEIDEKFIQNELKRRSPCNANFVSFRREDDSVEFISGIFEGKTTGAPIAFLINNTEHQSRDYENIRNIFRPSHADYTYFAKYGIRDHRGGGRASARESVVRVVAGAIAKLILQKIGVTITGYTSAIGEIRIKKSYKYMDLSLAEKNSVRCPDLEIAEGMLSHINKIKEKGDSIGGIVSCIIQNVPAGLGEPVYDKLNALLAHAMFSINSVNGFEIGSGFSSIEMLGSEHNDGIYSDMGKIRMRTNNSGGIQGGISNGEDIYFNVSFKPISSIKKRQKSINKNMQEIFLEITGRHDVCAVPRAVPIVEAMAAITIVDAVLHNPKISKKLF